MARRPRQRSFAARYAPLLLALVVVLVVVGLRTDDNLGVDLPRSGAEATDDGAGRTTTTEDEPDATLQHSGTEVRTQVRPAAFEATLQRSPVDPIVADTAARTVHAHARKALRTPKSAGGLSPRKAAARLKG